MVPSQNLNQFHYRFDYNRDPIFSQTRLPAKWQSDNYMPLSEGYQSIKNGMFNSTTGLEPVYGHMNYPRNPLNQEQTNRAGRAMQMQTQIEAQGAPHTQNPFRTMSKIPSKYPYTRGIAHYALGLPGIHGQ